MDFSQTLQQHRRRRRLSQLEVAGRAGTTQRHLSFMESGRSVPGRSMVVRLAEGLELSLRERNDLLLAAGYAPVFPETPLDAPALAPMRAVLVHILDGHLPYPAIAIQRQGKLVAANTAFDLLTEGVAAELCGVDTNVYRLALHPQGMAPRIRNFATWARHVLQSLERESLRAADAELDGLRLELEEYVPNEALPHDHLGFAVPMEFHSSLGELCLITTITTFATAVDVTIAELRLEAFLPADQATATLLGRRPAC